MNLLIVMENPFFVRDSGNNELKNMAIFSLFFMRSTSIILGTCFNLLIFKRRLVFL